MASGVGIKTLNFIRKPKELRRQGEGKEDGSLREIRTSLGSVSQAAGSSYAEFGACKILCSVYGPKPDSKSIHFSHLGRVACSVQFAPNASGSGVDRELQEQREKELPLVIRPALEAAVHAAKFPKSVVEVNILVLEEEGDVIGPCISCASLALADAGIEMFDLVAACSATLSPAGTLKVSAS